MNIHLKRGEKIYVNGAVLRVDRRASIEFLNDVTFLLEPHIMQAEDATTPVRQLYFVVQMMLIDPVNAAATYELYRQLSSNLKEIGVKPAVQQGLAQADRKLADDRPFDALKLLRGLFDLESEGEEAADAPKREELACN
jgi:flagellar biosynthesis repressor protein FlbT